MLLSEMAVLKWVHLRLLLLQCSITYVLILVSNTTLIHAISGKLTK